MRRRTFYAAAAVISVLATAGCAQAASTSPAAGAAGAASSATAPVATAPSIAVSPSGTAFACTASPLTAGALSLSEKDNGKTFCVTTGTVVVILLRGTLSDKWQPPRSSSGSLGPMVDPRMMLQVGVTGAAFRAIRPGASTVTSVRYPCQLPAPAGSAAAVSSASPAVHCDSSRMVFRVALVVTAR
jgi:hypothetical protein